MPQFLISEPADAILRVLGEALDLVDFGILLLNRDLRARFINQRFAEIWALPQSLLASGPTFRDLLDNAAANDVYAVPPQRLQAYLDEREAAVRAGIIPSTVIDLKDGRRMMLRCIVCPDGGRIVTYTDVSALKKEQELQHDARDAAERIGAELRFSNETLESQAAYLASLAEAAEENAQNAETAKRALEHEITERRQLEAQLRRMATTDSLTGSLNRAHLMTIGQREMDRVRLLDQGFAVMMVDVDHFKSINDRHGHPVGDLALQHLVETLRLCIRRIDLLGRMGGEEFAVILPAIPPTAAVLVAERIRAKVAATPLVHGGGAIAMTISIGLAIAGEGDSTVERLLGRADAALYQAKHNGRNRICADESQVEPEVGDQGDLSRMTAPLTVSNDADPQQDRVTAPDHQDVACFAH